LVFICFALIYINILIAKRKLQEWRGYSGWFFALTVVGVLIRERAALWVDRFGYSEAQALVLSWQQFAAMAEMFAAVFGVMIVFSNWQTR
jgi:hypothetical protein